jgi:transcriptional regulator with XRE-family HTH domain
MSAISRLKKKLATTHYRLLNRNTLLFAVNLNQRMKKLGMRNKDLAETIGTSPAYISKVLRGDANYTVETMAKLAHAVNADLDIRMYDKPVIGSLEFEIRRDPCPTSRIQVTMNDYTATNNDDYAPAISA